MLKTAIVSLAVIFGNRAVAADSKGTVNLNASRLKHQRVAEEMREEGRKKAKEIQAELPDLSHKAKDRSLSKNRRLEAIQRLSASQDDRAYSALLDNLADSDEEIADVSAHAAATLMRFSDQKGKDRARAGQELNRLGQDESLWKKKRYKLLQAAARGLYNAADDDAAFPIVERLFQSTRDFRTLSFLLEHYETGELTIRPRYRALFLDAMSNKHAGPERLKAARILAKVGEHDAVKELLNLLKNSTDREVRAESLRSLWEMGNAEGREAAASIPKTDKLYRFAQDLLKTWK